MANSLVIYHGADLDGRCSGAIAYQYLDEDVTLVPANYGDPIHALEAEYDTIYILDFSLEPYERMHQLKCKRLVWIDHHKSSLENFTQNPLGGNAEVIINLDYAACELAWAYFSSEQKLNLTKLQNPPLAIKLLGSYDRWNLSDDRVIPFQFGVLAEEQPITNKFWWNRLFNDPHLVEGLIWKGNLINSFLKKYIPETIKLNSFIAEWEGHKWFVINGYVKSIFLNRYREQYDGVMVFYFGDNNVTVTLYSSRFDVSEIAKKYGGGGHKGAAGFVLPFSKFNEWFESLKKEN